MSVLPICGSSSFPFLKEKRLWGHVKYANMSAGFCENVTNVPLLMRVFMRLQPEVSQGDFRLLDSDAHESLSSAVCSREERPQEK